MDFDVLSDSPSNSSPAPVDDFMSAPQTRSGAGSNNSSQLDDSFFSSPQQAPMPEVNEQPLKQQGSSDFTAMLGGSDDDDLFGNEPAPQPKATEADHSAALDKWKAAKDAEIAERDADESSKISDMKTQGSQDLADFNRTVQEAQEKRAVHNKEVDKQMIAEIESETTEKWEKVVSLVDFNRSDLHERDVARMKALLLQLKH